MYYIDQFESVIVEKQKLLRLTMPLRFDELKSIDVVLSRPSITRNKVIFTLLMTIEQESVLIHSHE